MYFRQKLATLCFFAATLLHISLAMAIRSTILSPSASSLSPLTIPANPTATITSNVLVSSRSKTNTTIGTTPTTKGLPNRMFVPLYIHNNNNNNINNNNNLMANRALTQQLVAQQQNSPSTVSSSPASPNGQNTKDNSNDNSNDNDNNNINDKVEKSGIVLGFVGLAQGFMSYVSQYLPGMLHKHGKGTTKVGTIVNTVVVTTMTPTSGVSTVVSATASF